MIVAKTKLKKIPEKCTKCKFCLLEPYWGVRQGSIRVCELTRMTVPYVYNKEKRNWEYTKADGCPLVEM